MKIDVIAVNGSPLGQTFNTMWGKDGRVGVGGSELYMLTLCEMFTKAGHKVRLFNSPRQYDVSPFEQYAVHSFRPEEERDVVIGFRVLDDRFRTAKGLKVWLSCDQYAVGSFKDFSFWSDKVVCISPFHQDYFAKTYGIINTTYIDIPVRTYDYDVPDYNNRKYNKIPYKCLFSSVPERGLDILARCWPGIHRAVPESTLVITSDYRLWNVTSPLNEKYRRSFFGVEGVQFLGAVDRERLIKEQLESQLLVYPCTYDELFCISCSEAQYAGAYPITSDTGALTTTNMGTVFPGNPKEFKWMEEYVWKVIELLRNPALPAMQKEVIEKAKARFSPEVILKQWMEKIFK